MNWKCLAAVILFSFYSITDASVLMERISIIREYEEARADNSTFQIVCYFSMGGHAYKGDLPPGLNVTLCTHVILLGTFIDDSQIAIMDQKDISLYFAKIPIMKQLNPSLKVLISNQGKYDQFTTILRTAANRTRFALSTLKFLRKYSFDGLDMDWEFPEFSSDVIRPNYTVLIQTIRDLYNNDTKQHKGQRLMVTMAVSASIIWINRFYEAAKLAKYLDFVNVMTYDIHMYSGGFPLTGHNSPLFKGNRALDDLIFQTFNFDWSAKEWVKQGMPKSKVMMGIPTYAHTYSLILDEWHDVYAGADGVGRTGDFLSYTGVCEIAENSSTTVVWDDVCKVPYLFQTDLWVSFDNVRSVTAKTNYLLERGYPGAMVFSINADDYAGFCDKKTKWPLVSAIKTVADAYNSNPHYLKFKSLIEEEIDVIF